MSLRYYSRMRLLYNLLPLLLQSHSPRVVSIFAPGKEGNFFPDDLSLRSHYGMFNNISHVSFMTTFFFEAIVEQNPSLSCVHVYPGLVKTAEFENGLFPNWLKLCFKWIMLPVITPFCVSVEECGERNLFHSTSTKFFSPGRSEEAAMEMKVNPADGFATGVDGKSASGVYAVNWNGETIKGCENVYKSWRAQGMTEKVWRHTMRAFEAVENGLVFAE
jgi:hypothetical protein